MTVDELLTPLFSTTWGQRLGYGVAGLMAIVVLVAVIDTWVDWYHDVTLTAPSLTLQQNNASDSVLQQVALIPSMHLFGKYGVNTDGFIPVTALQIRLVGVIKAIPENFSKVIISESGKPSSVYQVGDVLESGVRIEGVSDDGVILENAGHLEKLPLQRPTLLFKDGPKPLLPREE